MAFSEQFDLNLLDDYDISLKKRIRKETNLLSSSSKEYEDNQIQVQFKILNNINGDTASKSCSYIETSKVLETAKKKETNIPEKIYHLLKEK